MTLTTIPKFYHLKSAGIHQIVWSIKLISCNCSCEISHTHPICRGVVETIFWISNFSGDPVFADAKTEVDVIDWPFSGVRCFELALGNDLVTDAVKINMTMVHTWKNLYRLLKHIIETENHLFSTKPSRLFRFHDVDLKSGFWSEIKWCNWKCMKDGIRKNMHALCTVRNAFDLSVYRFTSPAGDVELWWTGPRKIPRQKYGYQTFALFKTWQIWQVTFSNCYLSSQVFHNDVRWSLTVEHPILSGVFSRGSKSNNLEMTVLLNKAMNPGMLPSQDSRHH